MHSEINATSHSLSQPFGRPVVEPELSTCECLSDLTWDGSSLTCHAHGYSGVLVLALGVAVIVGIVVVSLGCIAMKMNSNV